VHLTSRGGPRESARSSQAGRGMRVAFLLRRFPTLSETFILNQITGLLDAGVDLEIFAWSPGTDGDVHPEVEEYGLMRRTRYLKPPRSRIRRLRRASAVVRRHPSSLLRAHAIQRHGRAASSLSLLYGGARFLQGGPYDVVHCQFGHLGLTALSFREIGALPGRIVVSFRGADLTKRRSKGYAALFRAADLILPVSELFGERLIALGCEPAKIRVHRSGIDLGRFHYAERRPDHDGPLRLLTVARFVEKKGIEYAIRAVARMKGEGYAVVHRIVGEGPMRAQLEALTRELEIQDVSEFVGTKDHGGVSRALEWAHVLVAPSVTATSGDQEGIPNVLKEAMATGLPVVSTLHSGIPELVEEGVSGFLVPERDVESLATRLMYLSDHPERWAAMGRAGRQRIEADYDSEGLNERLLGLYREVLSAPAAG
jgi:colanic acid/amylovoran biosynthesis glycosyltransferase